MVSVPTASLADATPPSATGCADLKRAQKKLGLLAGGAPTRGAVLAALRHPLEAIPLSPDPDRAPNTLERLAQREREWSARRRSALRLGYWAAIGGA